MFSCRQGEKDLSLVSLGLSHGLMDKISPYWRVRGETNPDLVKPGSNVNGWFRWNLTGLVALIKCKQNRQIYIQNLTILWRRSSVPGGPATLRLLWEKCHKFGKKILAPLEVKFRCLAAARHKLYWLGDAAPLCQLWPSRLEPNCELERSRLHTINPSHQQNYFFGIHLNELNE